MTDFQRIILRKLAFTGAARETAELGFVPGVNVIWGASNAGKSFTVKALDYMFGAGTPLPEIRERQGYEACWLELDLPKSGRVTLYRSLAGGGFRLFEGELEAAQAGDIAGGRQLAGLHAPKAESLSSFLLAELGVSDKRIAQNQNGKTSSLTFRHFAAYMLTEETPMMSESSPIKINQQTGDTTDKNILKFLLTGTDDSSVVQTQSVGDQRTANAGKIEIVEEMIAAAAEELKRLFPDDDDIDALDLSEQENRLSTTIARFQDRLARHQTLLDSVRRERRNAFDAREDLSARSSEIILTLQRFDLLAAVYDSDIERLVSLEEGAAALMAGARRACPLCGADPEHQHEAHGLEHVERSQRAVRAEIAKIKAERADLGKTTTSLRAERVGITKRIEALAKRLWRLDRLIERIKPLEANSRSVYEEIDRARRRLRDGLAIKDRIEKLNVRKLALESFKPTSTSRDSIVVGVPGTVGHDFATVVQGILEAWRFPGDPVVSFNEKTHDIQINGADRRSNGKGVRALMNAAFKIGVMVYCRSKKLPHPGVIALDSPLLSYRDPHSSRHGELSSDERAVTRTGLNEHFYRYLLKQADTAQFIIIENDAPPFDLGPDARVSTFVGETGEEGRRGLL